MIVGVVVRVITKVMMMMMMMMHEAEWKREPGSSAGE